MTKTILKTARLVLREFNPEDANALARVICDPETMQYFPMRFQRADADEWIARNRRRYAANGHGLWAVVLNASGEMIGDCGIVEQEVDSESLPEIGYHLNRDFWGHGFATEAAQACRDWGFEQLQTDLLISLIRPENEPSRRVAVRNGMIAWKRVIRAGLAHDVYRIGRAEWKKKYSTGPDA